MKYIPYGRQYIDRSDIKEVTDILRSDWITQGPKIAEFERSLCDYTGAKYAVVASSGTAALHIACMAAGLKEGDEAITTPITFLATPNSVVYTGAKPVFADIQHDTTNIDPVGLEKKITKKTKAILPVHFAGLPCDMPRISKLAKKNNLVVIEDACHALGAKYKYNGKMIKIGSCRHSDMTVLSFHPVKHITTGEGGAVLTNNKKYYEKLIIFREHGVTRDSKKLKNKGNGTWYYEMQHLGYNYRLTDMQCALGMSQLKKIRKFIAHRRKIARSYNNLLRGVEGIELPEEKAGCRSSWHLYPIRLKNARKRKAVFEALRKNNIGVQVHYIPVHLQPYYREMFRYKEGEYPVSEKYYKQAISLPIHFRMDEKEVRYITKVIKGLLK